MKLIMCSLALIIIFSGCSKRDEPYKPTAQEMKDRNDTSGHPTNIGHNESF